MNNSRSPRPWHFARNIIVTIIAAICGLCFYPPLSISAAPAAIHAPVSKDVADREEKALLATFNKELGGNIVGSIPSDFSVTPSGQAHYSISIDVPPGTAKMQPALALTYDSNSSNTHNGLLGMGFNLEGLTSITRCPSNKAQNGVIHGVDFTDNDRFCLGGEQLVAIKGTYGQNGTEYRTYDDSQARIISYGRIGNGPAYFIVETKGGQKAQYAMTPDSQVKAQGTSTVAVSLYTTKVG